MAGSKREFHAGTIPSQRRVSSKTLNPILFFGQFRHACANLIPDRTDNLDGLTLWVGQRPIQLFESRNVRACISAALGHEQCGLLRQFRRQELRLYAGLVDPFLAHDLNNPG